MRYCSGLTERVAGGFAGEPEAVAEIRRVFCNHHTVAAGIAAAIYDADPVSAPVADLLRLTNNLDIAVTDAGTAAIRYGASLSARGTPTGEGSWLIYWDMAAAVEDLWAMQIRTLLRVASTLGSRLTIEAAVVAHKEQT